MKINYVTISREYGSGGREVGRKLADKLGIPLYDKEIIEQTAFKTGFAEDYVKKQGEYASARNWIEYSFSARNSYGMSPEDYLWAKQREVILDLVAKGPCVIIGRCADYILRDRKFNYRYYTEQEWGKCQNYDLTLDSGSLGIDHCVDIIYHICQDDEVEKTPKPAEE